MMPWPVRCCAYCESGLTAELIATDTYPYGNGHVTPDDFNYRYILDDFGRPLCRFEFAPLCHVRRARWRLYVRPLFAQCHFCRGPTRWYPSPR